MSAAVKVEDLQTALMERAKALADEYLERARRDHDRDIEEANEHLRLREEHEMAAAKAMGERSYRQKVQANEIKMREEVDHLRWSHVQNVLSQLKEQLIGFTKNKKAYVPLLQQLIASAAVSIEDSELIAEVNATDHELLSQQWDAIAHEAAPDKHITLAAETRDSAGGIILRNKGNTIRVDNSFEGRMERFQNELEEVVMERLFASAAPMGALFNG